jgi:hypothetical protein
MLVSIAELQKTDIVDWESSRIQSGSIAVLPACANMYAYCSSVVPETVLVELVGHSPA